MHSKEKSIVLCGAGAVGSFVAFFMASSIPKGTRVLIVDDDRIEEQNIPTTVFFERDTGRMKATVLSEMLIRKNMNLDVSASLKTLAPSKMTAMKDARLVLDCFDNIDARKATMGANTLHVGLSADRTGAITWNEKYTLPSEYLPRGENPVCTNELGLPIILATASLASIVALNYIRNGERKNALITTDYKPIYY